MSILILIFLQFIKLFSEKNIKELYGSKEAFQKGVIKQIIDGIMFLVLSIIIIAVIVAISYVKNYYGK